MAPHYSIRRTMVDETQLFTIYEDNIAIADFRSDLEAIRVLENINLQIRSIFRDE